MHPSSVVHLFARHAGLIRFCKYALIGSTAFFIDLLLLTLLTEFFKVNYIIAVPSAFLFATSLHYLVSRFWVFPETTRRAGTGWVLFIVVISSSLLLVSGGVWLLVEMVSVPVLIARIFVAPLVGFWSFFINSLVTFRTPLKG